MVTEPEGLSDPSGAFQKMHYDSPRGPLPPLNEIYPFCRHTPNRPHAASTVPRPRLLVRPRHVSFRVRGRQRSAECARVQRTFRMTAIHRCAKTNHRASLSEAPRWPLTHQRGGSFRPAMSWMVPPSHWNRTAAWSSEIRSKARKGHGSCLLVDSTAMPGPDPTRFSLQRGALFDHDSIAPPCHCHSDITSRVEDNGLAYEVPLVAGNSPRVDPSKPRPIEPTLHWAMHLPAVAPQRIGLRRLVTRAIRTPSGLPEASTITRACSREKPLQWKTWNVTPRPSEPGRCWAEPARRRVFWQFGAVGRCGPDGFSRPRGRRRAARGAFTNDGGKWAVA